MCHSNRRTRMGLKTPPLNHIESSRVSIKRNFHTNATPSRKYFIFPQFLWKFPQWFKNPDEIKTKSPKAFAHFHEGSHRNVLFFQGICNRPSDRVSPNTNNNSTPFKAKNFKRQPCELSISFRVWRMTHFNFSLNNLNYFDVSCVPDVTRKTQGCVNPSHVDILRYVSLLITIKKICSFRDWRNNSC